MAKPNMNQWSVRLLAFAMFIMAGLYLGNEGRAKYREMASYRAGEKIELAAYRVNESEILRDLIHVEDLESIEAKTCILSLLKIAPDKAEQEMDRYLARECPCNSKQEHGYCRLHSDAQENSGPKDFQNLRSAAKTEYIQSMEFSREKLAEERYVEAMDGLSMCKAIVKVYGPYLKDDEKAIMFAYADSYHAMVVKAYEARQAEIDAEHTREIERGLLATIGIASTPTRNPVAALKAMRDEMLYHGELLEALQYWEQAWLYGPALWSTEYRSPDDVKDCLRYLAGISGLYTLRLVVKLQVSWDRLESMFGPSVE